MEWEAQIPGCFGIVDQVFAGHPLDEQRAFDLLTRLRRERPAWDDVVGAFERHLRGKDCGPEHITEQMDRVRRHYAPWLE